MANGNEHAEHRRLRQKAPAFTARREKEEGKDACSNARPHAWDWHDLEVKRRWAKIVRVKLYTSGGAGQAAAFAGKKTATDRRPPPGASLAPRDRAWQSLPGASEALVNG